MAPPPFNLKQRLAALSLAQSSPSSPNTAKYTQASQSAATDPSLRTPITPNGKRKFFNAPNWLKKGQDEVAGLFNEPMYRDEERMLVQDVMSKMIFQAGVDFETRPMVVFNASALPDPQLVPYDLLLGRILSYLNLYVEADYTVIFFAAGSKHAPSWNWVWKAYRSLSRKYRKNLKQLYIVHSSFFSKMLFSLAGAIISPKFFRKIVYITTLSELAKRVPLTQIDIPPAVYQENLKYERKITLPIPVRSSLFGVPLEDIMGYNGEKGGIPRVVKDAIQYLRDTGLHEEGLFRRSPSSSLLRAAQEAYDRGNVVSLETFADPHLAAVLLKKYLRDLPEPIFPESVYGVIRQCPLPSGASEDEESVQFVRTVLLAELVPCSYILLSHVLHLLHDVSLRSDYNRMDATNLAIVICPNLVKGANPMRDVMMCNVPISGTSTPTPSSQTQTLSESLHDTGGRMTLGMIVSLCIRRYYEIFDEVVDRSEAIAPWRALSAQDNDTSSAQNTYVLGDGEEDDDLDDEMLVMPIRMDQEMRAHSLDHDRPISSRGIPVAPATYHFSAKRHRNSLSNGRNGLIYSQSVYNDNTSNSSAKASSSSAYHTNSRARSVINIEQSNSRPGISGKVGKGSIAVGRGTTRKGSGAAVEAVSVIAEGFFSAPNVPPLQKRQTAFPEATNQSDLEEPRLSVSERRQMFERGI